jgi:hypothetical protein
LTLRRHFHYILSQMKTEKAMTPGVATFVAGGCTAFGIVMFLAGLAMFIFAAFNLERPGATASLFWAVGIVAASFMWFALAAIVALLSHIAENTSKGHLDASPMRN